jgi:proline dehydrogenase
MHPLLEGLLLRVAKRWICGTDAESALEGAKTANGKHMSAIINFLGEDVIDQSVAEANLREYLEMQQAISNSGINGCVSVKLTQFGLDADATRCEERLSKVVANSSRLGQLLWIDMESSRFLDKTLEIYLRARERSEKVGVALQAYLRRSELDLTRLIERGARIRLVKGAYRESHDLAFPTRVEATNNYSKLMKILFERSDNFVIGTHDSRLIDEARRLSASGGVNFEFEMLKGVRDGLKGELVNSGYKVGEYLPYGAEWYRYSRRRISEHPSNIILLIRSLL